MGQATHCAVQHLLLAELLHAWGDFMTSRCKSRAEDSSIAYHDKQAAERWRRGQRRISRLQLRPPHQPQRQQLPRHQHHPCLTDHALHQGRLAVLMHFVAAQAGDSTHGLQMAIVSLSDIKFDETVIYDY